MATTIGTPCLAGDTPADPPTAFPQFDSKLLPLLQTPSDELGSSVSYCEPFLVAGAKSASSAGVPLHGAGSIWRLTPAGWLLESSVTPPELQSGLRFGGAVAVSRSLIHPATHSAAVFGADGATVDGKLEAGAVFLYRRQTPQDTWNFNTKFVASDAQAGDRFGAAVAMDGDLVAIAAPQRNGFRGAIYLFRLVSVGKSTIVWQEEAILTANDGSAGDRLGASVAVVGNRVVASAVQADVAGVLNKGAIFVFERENGTWSQRAKLSPASGAANDLFGAAIAIDASASTIVGATAPISSSVLPKVHVFELGPETWTQTATLSPPVTQVGDKFGTSLATDGERIVAGAPMRIVDSQSSRGAIFAFAREAQSDGWGFDQMVVDAGGKTGDAFGSSVTMQGEALIAGAKGVDAPGAANAGAVLAYWSQDCNEDGTLSICHVSPADLDGDSFVNCVEVAIVLGHWGLQVPGLPADVNDDGVVDGLDLAILLGDWTG